MRTLVWFRHDLRTNDNTALHHAARAATNGVVGLFIVSPDEWRRHDVAPCKVEFILRTLRVLSDDLASKNIPLLIERAEKAADVPALVRDIARRHACDVVHCNTEYEINETIRDENAADLLREIGAAFHAHHDQCVIEPGSVRTKQDGAYTVFTPFKKTWFTVHDDRGGAPVLPAPKKQPEMPQGLAPSPAPERVEGYTSDVPAELHPGGEHAAMRRLTEFAQLRIGDYKTDRDYPAINGTSVISPYLAIGAISPRQCLRAALDANDGRLDAGAPGAVHWISELVWREFYKHILVAFPRVCMHRAFKPETDRLPWRYDEAEFQRWCDGQTGVPIVDAAMRQLRATGWMHNRLRMIAAMYLTKDLFIDWRWGERWFMRNLVDGDLASNNGGWQWSASTGTDAAPYFRIFNPVSQSRRWDEQGEFIRHFVHELIDLDDADIHDPSAIPGLLRSQIDYPEPMVDHRKARDRVMAAFRAIAGDK
ncbi:MAG: deoxyribodipyrimidine photo-lyase [Phycisphaerales bacterium]|nr:MAG: deoxyribodipyrimidine photo-lyase [Phycisphaerales bacterium]